MRCMHAARKLPAGAAGAATLGCQVAWLAVRWPEALHMARCTAVLPHCQRCLGWWGLHTRLGARCKQRCSTRQQHSAALSGQHYPWRPRARPLPAKLWPQRSGLVRRPSAMPWVSAGREKAGSVGSAAASRWWLMLHSDARTWPQLYFERTHLPYAPAEVAPLM